MRSIERRLKCLEARMGGTGPQVVAFIRTGVPRWTDGPEGAGIACATFLSGPSRDRWMPRDAGEMEAAFLQRVEIAKRGA